MPAIIDVQSVAKSFGGLQVIHDCSIAVAQGSITGLIGPNGAGKSTLFNIIAGTLEADSGTVRLAGEDITGVAANELFARGLLRTFQIAHEFSHLTALENLMMVPGDQIGENLSGAWLHPARTHSGEVAVRQRALDVLDFLSLSPVKNELAGNLSGGQKKLLELGRTMMVDARVVLLDEIAAGVNRTLLNDLASNIERLNRELGYTFLVIEHDMDLITRLCDPIVVLSQGRVMMSGSMAEIRANRQVIEAYFGTASSMTESA